jgi:hypothetical protein
VERGDFATLVEGIVTADAFRIRTKIRDSARPPLPSARPAVD